MNITIDNQGTYNHNDVTHRRSNSWLVKKDCWFSYYCIAGNVCGHIFSWRSYSIVFMESFLYVLIYVHIIGIKIVLPISAPKSNGSIEFIPPISAHIKCVIL